jgi:two-component system cell cycle sensor histidine kinase/response regulator CckA
MPEYGTETVLVVDDEMAVLSLAQLMLTRYGYSVLTATSGREALHLLKSGRTSTWISLSLIS